MTIKDALQGSGLPSADAEVLLSHVINRNRAWMLGHGDDPLAGDHWTLFMQWVDRRRKHEPVAYITGTQEFYGRPFFVDRRVLIPRPATEGVVIQALQFLKESHSSGRSRPRQISVKAREVIVDEGIVVVAKELKIMNPEVRTIVDIGTGSGCIAITLALERPDLQIIATDISADALEVARTNAAHHQVQNRVTLRQGNGLEPIQDLTEPFLLVSNPPYIAASKNLMPDVKDFEPYVALFGGTAGNEIPHRIAEEAAQHPFCIGWVMEGPPEMMDPRNTP